MASPKTAMPPARPASPPRNGAAAIAAAATMKAPAISRMFPRVRRAWG